LVIDGWIEMSSRIISPVVAWMMRMSEPLISIRMRECPGQRPLAEARPPRLVR
jgi:hypothetical protein